jgi:hypothetical protein
MTVEGAVLSSGAQTQQEKAEFRQLLQELNGEKLQEAQQRSLDRQENNLERVADPTAKQFFARSLQGMRENPDRIPLETHQNNLLIPNFRYSHFEGQKEGEIFRTPVQENLEHLVHNANGVYFSETRAAQVDVQALHSRHGEKVVIHEMAHALDHLMKQESPEFHEQWHGRLQNAYEQAAQRRESGQAVNSDYGMTNHAEYIAEGVEILFSNPEHLKETDPALHQLALELLEQGSRQGDSLAHRNVQSKALQRLSLGFVEPRGSVTGTLQRFVPRTTI